MTLHDLLPIFTAVGLGSVLAAIIARGVAIAQLRQAWINALRDDIADFLGGVHKWAEMQRLSRKHVMTGEDARNLIECESQAEIALSRVAMRLNPREELHVRLLGTLRALRAPDPDYQRYSSIEQAISESQLVLKREWQVTKWGPIAPIVAFLKGDS